MAAALLVTVMATVMAAAGAFDPSDYLANSTSNKSSFTGHCPIFIGKKPFEPSKMAGEWRVAAGTPLFGSELSGCARFVVRPSRSDAGLFYDVAFAAKSPRGGAAYDIESRAQAYSAERGAFMLAVYRPKGANDWSPVFGQSIVATDYSTYALFVACRPDFRAERGRFERILAAQLWTRPDAQLSAEKRYVLKNVLSSYGAAEADIKDAPQEGCDA